jgi:hypothetical protein
MFDCIKSEDESCRFIIGDVEYVVLWSSNHILGVDSEIFAGAVGSNVKGIHSTIG